MLYNRYNIFLFYVTQVATNSFGRFNKVIKVIFTLWEGFVTPNFA